MYMNENIDPHCLSNNPLWKIGELKAWRLSNFGFGHLSFERQFWHQELSLNPQFQP